MFNFTHLCLTWLNKSGHFMNCKCGVSWFSVQLMMSISLCVSGVWWQRFLPLLHQHVSWPSVRPAGTGSHLWRTRCGRWFWQPLLQSLPLPAVATPPLNTQTVPCTQYTTNTHTLVSMERLADFFLHSPVHPWPRAVVVPSVWLFSTRGVLLDLMTPRKQLRDFLYFCVCVCGVNEAKKKKGSEIFRQLLLLTGALRNHPWPCSHSILTALIWKTINKTLVL